jgi:hypothetical protein
MQHLAKMRRPLTALILLAACGGGESTTLLSGKADPVNSSNAALEGEAGSGVPDVQPGEPDAAPPAEPPFDSAHPPADAGTSEPPTGDGGSLEVPPADAGAAEPPAPEVDAGTTEPPPPPLGACLSCAQNTCPEQFANALGAASSEENFATVGHLLGCVIGADWQAGGPIPAGSCFFSDPTQPSGSMVPCYCGSTPTAQCLATGPANSTEACAAEIELASGCSPVTASCVTVSGSSPAVALGDALQLFNCERVACTVECGFPAPIEE